MGLRQEIKKKKEKRIWSKTKKKKVLKKKNKDTLSKLKF